MIREFNMSEVLMAAEEGLQTLRSGKKLKRRLVEIPDRPGFTPQRITQLRERLGVSQTTFAHLLGTSPARVRAWEHGMQTPSGLASRILEIAEREPEVLTRT